MSDHECRPCGECHLCLQCCAQREELCLYCEISRLAAERDRLRKEKLTLQNALVGVVGEDNTATLLELIGALRALAAVGISSKDVTVNIAASRR